MKTAEIISIGSELLLGEILDTNAQYLSQELATLGIANLFKTTVGDNETRIKCVLKSALERADIIITTGGLGPTDDDITIGSLAAFFEKPLNLNEKALEQIHNYFKRLGREMPVSNTKQALFPENAFLIDNPVGTAPGMIWKIVYETKEKVILCFPGVPRELKPMFEGTARQYLKQYSGMEDVIVSRSINTFGISEALLGETVKEFLKEKNPTVAPLVGKFYVRLRMTANAPTKDEALKLITKTENCLKKLIDPTFIYGYDNDTLESQIGKLLIEKKQTISVAESCTGGLVSSRLTDISGSSDYITYNVVTYSNEAKTRFLGVDKKLIEQHGAVSQEVASAMAEGIKKVSGSNYGIAISGIAGPSGGSSEKPVGLAFMAICDKNGTSAVKIFINSQLTREDIKWGFSQHVLNMLRLRLLIKQQEVTLNW